MKEHLKRKHPDDNPFEPSDEKRKYSKPDVFTKKRPCSVERAGAISERASERVTRMIIKDLHPINMVSGEGFRDLMAFMEPEYRLPSATHFTHLIEQRYQVVKEKMRGIFCADSVAITADIWTSITTDSYLTVTIHYLSEEWEMKSIVSGTLPLLESHTADNLATWIKEMVEETGVCAKKVVAFIHNCKNIENAGKALESEHGWV